MSLKAGDIVKSLVYENEYGIISSSKDSLTYTVIISNNTFMINRSYGVSKSDFELVIDEKIIDKIKKLVTFK